MGDGYVLTKKKGNWVKCKADPKCPVCHGTGRISEIVFGNPGTITKDCWCTRKWDENAHDDIIRL